MGHLRLTEEAEVRHHGERDVGERDLHERAVTRDLPLARRCEQTVLALGRKYKMRPELAPDTTPDALLSVAGWPQGKSVVLLVGHQPSLGQSISLLLGMQQDSCVVRKGAVWWIRTRERDGDTQTVVVTVQSPEMV